MNPTLNSPKYAAPESLDYRLHKIQQERKNRKKFVPQLEQRYFRRNEGSTDYATIPEVTLAGDFVIEFEFSTTNTTTFGRIVTSGDTTSNYLQVILNGSTGSLLFELSNGTSKVFISTGLNVNDGALHSGRVRFSSLDSTYYASVDGGAEVGQSLVGVVNKVSTIYKSDSAGGLLQGILANLKIYDNGTLVRDYPLDDNSDTIRDKANGQDGTIINGNASDWGLFDRQADGDWLGQELVVNGGFDSTDGWTLGAGWSISDGLASHVSSSTSNLNQSANPLRESSVYLSSFSVTDVTPSVDGVRIRIGSGGNGVLREEEGTYSEIITATNNELLFTANAFFTGSIDNVSVKEVLKNA